LAGSTCPAVAAAQSRPNILILMTDDQSWLHAGYAGDPVVRTPNLDRLAGEGVVFEHAYVSSPSCTPSRAAFFTGRNFYELEAGANLHGMLDAKFTVFPSLLRQHGYDYGYTGKGVAPRTWRPEAQTFDAAGGGFVKVKIPEDQMPFPGMNPNPGFNTDYAATFEKFLDEREGQAPFAFFCGFVEPHLPYAQGSGRKSGLDPGRVKVPPYAADNEMTRQFFLDYYREIEFADEHIGRMIETLRQRGELDNTLIIFTADNGIAGLPRAKGNLYDWGVRVPLVVCWKGAVEGGRTVTDFVSLTDVAPTILQACGIGIPADMTGRSFLDVLFSGKGGRVDAARNRVFFGKEFHNPDEIFPMRGVRTDEFLYIHNFNPDVPKRWTLGGAPPVLDAKSPDFGPTVSAYPDLYIIRRRNDPEIGKLYDMAYGPRPREELYDVKHDRWQLNNLAEDPAYAEIKAGLKQKLFEYLGKTGDPRIGDDPDVFHRYFEKYAPKDIK